LLDQVQYLRHRSFAVVAQRHHRNPPTMIAQALEVAPPLGLDQRPEAVVLARDGDVLAPLVGKDQVDAAVGAALVELPGGMQVARPVP